MTEVVSARLTDDVLALLDEARGETSRGAWVTTLVEAELTGDVPMAVAGPPATHEVPAGGIPSPGVQCMWQRCGGRDTSRYGVTGPAELERRNYREVPRDENAVGLALCPAHANLLGRLIYRRSRQPAA